MSSRAGLLLCVLLVLGCERQTGYCERPEDCTVTVTKTMLGGEAADGAGGTIRSEPSRLLCDATCMSGQAVFPMGVGVKLTVEPAPGWRFAGWSGPCEGVTPTCTVQVGTAQQVQARFVRKVCSQEGWCWENPLPTGNDLVSVWASAPNDVWAVGRPRTLVHWDGIDWAGVNIPDEPTAYYSSIWASSSKDVWVTAYKGKESANNPYDPLPYLHWDGNTWSRVPVAPGTNTLGHIWGTSATDIWAVGDGGSIAHYDGTAWSRQTSNVGTSLRGVWAPSAASDVWVVGSGGTLLRGGTNGWTKVAPPADVAQFYFDPVWGSGTNDVWAAGGRIINWNGSNWTTKEVGLSYNLISAIWGSGKENVWFAESTSILHWDGRSFGRSTTVNNQLLSGLHGSNPNDIWSVGTQGIILRYEGKVWSPQSTDVTRGKVFTSVWGRNVNDIWAVGKDGLLLKWNGVVWTQISTGEVRYYKGVFGSRSGDVWFVTDNVLYQWNDSTSTIQRAAEFDEANKILLSGWSFSPDDVWVGFNGGRIRHWDGRNWVESIVPAGVSDIRALWGSADGSVYAMSTDSLLRWNGVKWEFVPGVPSVAPLFFQKMEGSRPDDLWLVASNDNDSAVIRFDGKVWARLESPKGAKLYAVWTNGDGQAWGATQQGIWRWNGTTWKLASSGTGLGAIWGSSSDNLWAVGEAGAMLHYQR